MTSPKKPARRKQARQLQAEAEAQTFNEAFGLALRKMRRRAGVTIAELADACGKGEMTIFSWQAGNTSPTAESIVKMAAVLQKHPCELWLAVDPRHYDMGFLHADGPPAVASYK